MTVHPFERPAKRVPSAKPQEVDPTAEIDASWPKKLLRKKKGGIIVQPHNIALILRHHEPYAGAIRLDTFRHRKERSKPLPWAEQPDRWADLDTIALRAHMHETLGLIVPNDCAIAAVELVAHQQRYDSLIQHLDSLQWDGYQRADTFLIRYFGAKDTQLNRIYSRRFLTQMMARAYRPGAKADCMLILEGSQGAGKSTAWKALAGEEFFRDDALDFHDKDSMRAVNETWIQEMGELVSLKRAEATGIKAFLTKTADYFRPSYGREFVELKRRCVFVGTTNENIYLDDPTGARRFWSVQCGRADLAGITRDREAILAEARMIFEGGEKWWIDETEDIATLARESQASRQHEHPWSEMIQSWLSTKSPIDCRGGFTAIEILEHAVSMQRDKISKRETMQLAGVMRQLNYERTEEKVSRNGARVRVYVPISQPSETVPNEENDPWS